MTVENLNESLQKCPKDSKVYLEIVPLKEEAGIEPGEKSKVVEEDWVGTFKVRVRFDKWDGKLLASIGKFCAYSSTSRVYDVLAKQGEPNVFEKEVKGCGEEDVHMIYSETTLDFEGGSLYLVVSQDEDGNVAFKLK